MHSKEFEEEFEILKSIYEEIALGDENTTNGEAVVSIVLYPSTCDDDETRYVTLCLEFNISPEYPSRPPTILFRNPRGLSEAKLTDLHSRLMKKCVEDLLDTPMLFQIIDSVQEFLTTNNLPASDCPICLNSFHPSDVFYRSKCFHYFHSQCLGKFLQNILKNNNTIEATTINGPSDAKIMAPQFQCPVCREELDPSTIDIDKFLDSPPPFGEAEDEELIAAAENGIKGGVSAEWLEHREHMKSLYEKQEKQGGIIDLNQQLGKLLVISTPPSTQTPVTDETESVESVESNYSPDSGTGTTSSSSKISPSSSDSSQVSFVRPLKLNNDSRASAKSGATTGKDDARDVHHHHHPRSHNYRHFNHRAHGHTHPRHLNEGHAQLANTGTQPKISNAAKQEKDAVIVGKSKQTVPIGTENSESRSQSQSKHGAAASGHVEGQAIGHDKEKSVKGINMSKPQPRSKPTEGATQLVSGDVKGEQPQTDGKNTQNEQHGRIRNFRHSNTRGHQRYNNHHSRGYGGARKYDQSRQNYAEDQ